MLAAPAAADEKAACLDAAARGQRFRATHQLVEAREQFRACAAAACPGVVQSDCASWLVDVERTLPSVVVTARDESGGDLADVAVSVDGRALGGKVDGQATVMNPGRHTFHFERSDRASVDRIVVVKEGEQNQGVAVVLPTLPPSTSPGHRAELDPQSPNRGSTWATLGWVLAGAGIVGLGVGTVFGISAIGDKNGAGCNASKQCEPGPVSSARSAALGADVGFIAGGILLAGGAALVLLGPHASPRGAKGGVAPKLALTLGVSGGGVVVGGSW